MPETTERLNYHQSSWWTGGNDQEKFLLPLILQLLDLKAGFNLQDLGSST